MKLYDISQEIFGCEVYPGDKAPQKLEDMRMSRGDMYNLTSFSMCAHNGTHIDAPFHFLNEGDTVEKIPPEKTVGECYVTSQNTDITADTAKEIIKSAEGINRECAKRILIKGKGVVTLSAAEIFAKEGIYLLGVESQTVGPENAPMAVHKILLEAKTVLLEGIRLSEISDGKYFLFAAPLALSGSDGAPCRAVLTREEFLC